MFIKIPIFPNSLFDPFLITSNQTPTYNCIAWAYEDNSRWYWPDPDNMYYWPLDVPRSLEIASFIILFEKIGYTCCSDGSLEDGYLKVAIFADSKNIPTHAARQLKNGYWTSKLGKAIDVQHSINAISHGSYGDVVVYMKRPIK